MHVCVWLYWLGIVSCVLEEDISRNFEDYITVDHAVDRSLVSGLCGGTYVRGGTEFTVVNLVCDSSRTVGCVCVWGSHT